MSEHFFLVGRGKVSDAQRERIEAVVEAVDEDVSFVNPTMPGEGPRYWFSCPNQGFPFDRNTAESVKGALDAAGLLDADGALILSDESEEV